MALESFLGEQHASRDKRFLAEEASGKENISL
jgi:hypothetical protein